MNYICPKCRGSGYIQDQSDHLDICETCWGLGYVEEAPEVHRATVSREERIIRRNALLVLAASISVFYVALYIISGFIKYSSIELVILLIASYYAGIFGSSLYVRHAMKKINSGNNHGNLPGNH